MSPKKIVKSVAIFLVATVAISYFMFNESDANIDIYMNKYNNVSQNALNRTSVQTVIEQVEINDDTKAGINEVPIPGVSTPSDLPTLTMEMSKHAKAYGYSQPKGHLDVDVMTITYNGVTKSIDNKVTRNDCSGYVSMVMYFTGVTDKYVSRDSRMFCRFGDPVNAKTFADVQVGDIIAKNGHVALCVAKDENYVYMGDWGDTEPIVRCAEQGWAAKYKVTDSISKWRSGKIYVRRVDYEN